MNYLHWDQKTITDFTDLNIEKLYANGYVFTRISKGVMQQTRSARIDLSKFDLTSENRRILKKVHALKLDAAELPLNDYDWKLGKLAKDFYDTKFEPGIMSSQKVKMMLVDSKKSNFNILLKYSIDGTAFGYAICYSNEKILHYCYPFYSIDEVSKDMGLGMMLLAIKFAEDSNLKHIYLGSLQRPSDTYKLQFQGLEWFDGKAWQTNHEAVKKLLISDKMA